MWTSARGRLLGLLRKGLLTNLEESPNRSSCDFVNVCVLYVCIYMCEYMGGGVFTRVEPRDWQWMSHQLLSILIFGQGLSLTLVLTDWLECLTWPASSKNPPTSDSSVLRSQTCPQPLPFMWVVRDPNCVFVLVWHSTWPTEPFAQTLAPFSPLGLM